MFKVNNKNIRTTLTLNKFDTFFQWFYCCLEYINVSTAQKILALQETTDLVTFAKEILNGKRHFLCSVCNINSELLLSSRKEAPCKTNSKLPNSQKPWHSGYSNEGLMRPVGSSSPRVLS